MATLGYPDGQPKTYPNQFAVNTLVATSTQNPSVGSSFVVTATAPMLFGFNAALIKIVVDGGGPAYLQFNGNVAGTGDYKVTSADLLTDWYDLGVTLSGLSVAATSTALAMRMGAWG